MARVSIEERAAVGAKTFARLMGWSRKEAIGALYFFWHDSQELEKTTCTRNDILDWLEINEHDDEQNLIPALIQSGFISQLSKDEFLICGNEKHIENLTLKRDAARENGKNGGRPKRSEDNQKETNVGLQEKPTLETNVGLQKKPTSETQVNQPDNHSSLQFSALQFNTRKKRESPVAAQPDLPELADIWNRISDPLLPKVQSMDRGSKRRKSCEERWRENPDPGYWRQVIEKINQSQFCLGANDRGWKADIEFLSRPDTHAKVLEGKYDSAAPPGRLERVKTSEELEMERQLAEQAAQIEARRNGYV